MTKEDILIILKTDLQICVKNYDVYLNSIIEAAAVAIRKEGIILSDNTEDGMLVEMYAAYLYRKRKEENTAMPRMLRWQLNNRLFSQKAVDDGRDSSADQGNI